MNRVRRQAQSDTGMTMIELVVTMAVMAVVMVILFGILDQTSRIVSRGNGDIQAENNLQLAMRTMSEDIRAASQISFTGVTLSACPAVPTSSNCLTFVVSHNVTAHPNCATTITYGVVPDTSSTSVTGSKVIRTTKQSYCATSINGTTTVLSNAAGSSLFNYYDGGDNVLTVGQAQAKSIEISLSSTYTKGGNTLNLSSFVALRNAR